MIIDSHAHVVAPPELFAYRSNLLASRGHGGKGRAGITDERLAEFAQRNVDVMDSVGTDVQFISPRPFQQMHSETPGRLVHWWIEACNDTIERETKVSPSRLVGVGGIPQVAGEPVDVVFDELERCAKERGFVGVLVNPDPYEGQGYTPPMGDLDYWGPLYEKLVELDMPALVHSASCNNGRESYSNHFITEESIAILSLIESDVIGKFPGLRLVISHGGGSVPYQIGRWRAHRFMRGGEGAETFDESLKKFYFDTCLYNQESLELLFKIVGPDRCMFGTEKPGSGGGIDPATGKALDDLKPVIENIDFLTEADRQGIFEDNSLKVYTKFKPAVAAG